MASPASLPPAVAAALAKGEKEGQAVLLWTVGMFCIFGWDYFMNLPDEIERVWKRKWTYISTLYMVNRYYGLVEFAVVICLITTTITGAISVETCSKIYLWQPVGAMLTTLFTQTIMGSRVYALYAQSRLIAMILGFIMLVEFIIHVYSITKTYPAPSPAPGVVVPCIAIGPTPWLVSFWAIPLVFDTTAFLMTLYKSWTYWKTQIESPTLSVFFRDGLVYFAAIFSMNLVNVVLFVTQDSTLQAINLPATLMLNIIMSCRLILNVRAPHAIHYGTSDKTMTLPSWKPKSASESLPVTVDTARQLSQGIIISTVSRSDSSTDDYNPYSPHPYASDKYVVQNDGL